jgi:hypothetical protein
MSIVTDRYCAPALRLLAEHCERWKTVHFYCRSSDIAELLGIKGKLPLLEKLELEVHDSPSPIDLFEVAPKLRIFLVGGLLPPDLAAVHLHQLYTVGCLGQEPTQVRAAVSFMSRLPPGMKFSLQLFLSHWAHDNILGIDLPPTISDIDRLSMDTCDYSRPEHCVKALSDIFNSLTLPHLRDLGFQAQEARASVIYWPHAAFTALAARSSFHTHLRSLCLCDVVITEAQLLGALTVLPLLQHLEISDHQVIENSGADQLLVTDSFLVALTLKPESHTRRLVPLLQSLLCCSLLKFDDHAYLQFLLSRRRREDSAPFACRMYGHPDYHRALDADVAARLRELRIQKEIVSEFSRLAPWRE